MGPLVELMPANARKYVYAVLSAAVFIYGLWEASQGDWVQFGVATVTALVALMATANTDKDAPTEEDVELAFRLGQMNAPTATFADSVDFEEDVEFDNPDSVQFDEETR